MGSSRSRARASRLSKFRMSSMEARSPASGLGLWRPSMAAPLGTAATRPWRRERKALLRDVRGLEAVLVRREKIAATDDAHQRLRRFAIDDGQPSDAGADHVIGRLAQRVVLVHDDGAAPDERADRGAVLTRWIDEIAAGHYATEHAILVHDGEPLVRAAGGAGEQPPPDVRKAIRRRERHDLPRRGVAHEHLTEIVGDVLGPDARPATGELFRHDGAPHHEQRYEVCGAAPGEQRQ